ncbi:MAG: TetR/AcrR family transcriptional regulator [bacterium]|nr:TetR/AcrR family transcriptional regulator [bacterium]
MSPAKQQTAVRRGTSHAPAHERRTQILEAAVRCFAESGYERTTMDDVARSSKLSKGSLYRFFPSKVDLLSALFELFEQRTFAILDATESPDSALVQLRGCGQLAIDLFGGPTELLNTWAEFLGHRESRERMRQVYRRWRRRLAEIVQGGITSGEIREMNPDDAAIAVLATFEGLLLQAMVDPRFDVRSSWPGVWVVVESGLRRTT